MRHVTEETALRYAEVDALLRKKGCPIPRDDVWSAALAIEHGLELAGRGGILMRTAQRLA